MEGDKGVGEAAEDLRGEVQAGGGGGDGAALAGVDGFGNARCRAPQAGRSK